MRSNHPGIKLEPALGTQEDKIEHLSSYAHVVHTTAKQVISRRRKNENVFKMSKDEKMHVQSVQKYCFSLSNMQICGVLLPSSSWFLKLPIREFKIYDATLVKTSLKIASSSLSIFFVIISVCVTFET